jgi:cyclin M-like protein
MAAELLFALALVAANGLFVASEFAIARLRPTQVADFVRQGKPGARSAQHAVDHIDAYLSACQLGITLASLRLGAIGEDPCPSPTGHPKSTASATTSQRLGCHARASSGGHRHRRPLEPHSRLRLQRIARQLPHPGVRSRRLAALGTRADLGTQSQRKRSQIAANRSLGDRPTNPLFTRDFGSVREVCSHD